jgi:hypothetical protein
VTVEVVVPLGTVKEHENAPDESVERLPDVQLLTATPSKSSDASVEETENPVPATVTRAPWGPCTGVTERDGVVTVKVPVAV